MALLKRLQKMTGIFGNAQIHIPYRRMSQGLITKGIMCIFLMFATLLRKFGERQTGRGDYVYLLNVCHALHILDYEGKIKIMKFITKYSSFS